MCVVSLQQSLILYPDRYACTVSGRWWFSISAMQRAFLEEGQNDRPGTYLIIGLHYHFKVAQCNERTCMLFFLGGGLQNVHLGLLISVNKQLWSYNKDQ